MKKLYTLLTLLVLGTGLSFAQSSKEIYNKYSDLPGFEAVYISPAMLRLVGKLPDVDVQGEKMDFNKVIRGLDGGFYLLNTEDAKYAKDLAADVKKLIDKGKYELLMEAKDHGEVVRIYTEGNDRRITSLVLLSMEKDEAAFISINGNIDREALENLIAEEARK